MVIIIDNLGLPLVKLVNDSEYKAWLVPYLSLSFSMPSLSVMHDISLVLLFISAGSEGDRLVISSIHACLHSVSGRAISPSNHITASLRVALGGHPLKHEGDHKH